MTLIVFQPVSTGFAVLARGFQPRAGRRKPRRFVSQSGILPFGGPNTVGIEVQNVSKHYGSFYAVDQVNLTIKTGSLVALLGPSGSGKSTLLRMIAGLETPDEGKIALLGNDATHQAEIRQDVFQIVVWPC
jgi:ABC-type glutathione transport system ATPase component